MDKEPELKESSLRPVGGQRRGVNMHLTRTFSALKHRNFQLFTGGQVISVAGTWMQIVAQSWLVYELTHSELALGVVAFMSAIPALIITPWGGVVVDRVEKRKLLVITQSAAMILAFVLAALVYTNIVQVWHIYILAAILGLVNAFDAPARQAFVVEMVSREDMPNAIALNSMVFNSGRVIGPAIGGLILATLGSAWAFFFNGVSFLAVIIGLSMMRILPKEAEYVYRSPLHQLSEGLRYVVQNTEFLGLILMSLIFSFFGLSYAAVLPAFVDVILHSNAGGYGAINTFTGLGAVSGAFLMASNSQMRHRGRWMIGSSLFFSVVLLLFAMNSSLQVALALAFGLGIGFMMQFTLINTILQTRVSDEMRGRVSSLYTLTFFGIAPFGNLLVGYVSEKWGLSITIMTSTIISAFLAILVVVLIPKLRKL